MPIRPGTDAYLLAAIANVLFDEGSPTWARSRPTSTASTRSRDLARAVHARGGRAGHRASTPATIRAWPAGWPRRPSAAVYGRIGTTTQEFGTLASWLVDVVNVLTGNLDRPGGAMFTKAAAGAVTRAPGVGRGFAIDRWHSRVRGLPESLGELPVAALADEIETPGEGQVRALVTVAGNPVLSTPNAERLDAPWRRLELHGVGRHLRQRDHPARRRDPAGAQRRCRSPTTTSPCSSWRCATSPTGPSRCCRSTTDQPDEWEVLAKLALIAGGAGPDADPAVADDLTSSWPLAEAAPEDGRAEAVARPAGGARPGSSTSCCAAGPTS